MNELCHYAGADTTAVLSDNDRNDGTYFSRCHCGVVTCESGTYDEASAALESHRAESSSTD